MKTSTGGWIFIICVVVGIIFLCQSFYTAALPQYADPMNGEHIKALQPKRCIFSLCDQQNQNSANTNLTNGQAENQYGQAAEHFAQATAIVNSGQPPMQPMGVTAVQYGVYCVVGILLLLVIGIIVRALLGGGSAT